MSPYSILILVYAFLYTVTQVGGLLVLSNSIVRQKTFRVNVLPLLIANAFFVLAAGVVNHYDA